KTACQEILCQLKSQKQIPSKALLLVLVIVIIKKVRCILIRYSSSPMKAYVRGWYDIKNRAGKDYSLGEGVITLPAL
ncbi:MAG: hypothetical protein MR792_09785, partial [Paraprevotella sp.]|nr:hypothetical protein [Paraprevotella sp.]